jgi:very-short-patch-repair endonuclease
MPITKRYLNKHSKIEKLFIQELNEIGFNFKEKQIVKISDAISLLPDGLDYDHGIVMEYDGLKFHKDLIEKDSWKTDRYIELGYTVVRVRELYLKFLSKRPSLVQIVYEHPKLDDTLIQIRKLTSGYIL